MEGYVPDGRQALLESDAIGQCGIDIGEVEPPRHDGDHQHHDGQHQREPERRLTHRLTVKFQVEPVQNLIN